MGLGGSDKHYPEIRGALDAHRSILVRDALMRGFTSTILSYVHPKAEERGKPNLPTH